MLQNLAESKELSSIFLEIYWQILLKVLIKVGLNFVHLALTKVSKIKQRVNLGPKSLFSIKDGIE